MKIRKFFTLFILSLTVSSLTCLAMESSGINEDNKYVFKSVYDNELTGRITTNIDLSQNAIALANTLETHPDYEVYRENERKNRNGWHLDGKNCWQYQKSDGTLASN